jgi:hypothetical protein
VWQDKLEGSCSYERNLAMRTKGKGESVPPFAAMSAWSVTSPSSRDCFDQRIDLLCQHCGGVRRRSSQEDMKQVGDIVHDHNFKKLFRVHTAPSQLTQVSTRLLITCEIYGSSRLTFRPTIQYIQRLPNTNAENRISFFKSSLDLPSFLGRRNACPKGISYNSSRDT